MIPDSFELCVSEEPHGKWEEYISICDGTVYHSPAWTKLAARGKRKPLFFSWKDDNGELAGIATGHKSDSTIPLIGPWNGRLTMGSTPAIRQNYRSDGTAFLTSLRDYAKNNGCKLLTIESHMGQDLQVDSRRIRLKVKPRIEFRINLMEDENDIWTRVSKHHRRKIKKAGGQNISIQSHRSLDAVRTLRVLQRGSQARRLERGEQMQLGADEPIIDLMQGILNQDLGKLFLAEVAGEVISGALISVYRDRVYYVFGGSNQRGFSLNAPGLLFWEMIKQSRKEGCREFNLGGVPAHAARPESQAHGLYRFKSGFGGDMVNRADYSINLHPIVTAVAIVGSKLLRQA